MKVLKETTNFTPMQEDGKHSIDFYIKHKKLAEEQIKKWTNYHSEICTYLTNYIGSEG